jgi:hypothetical protein
MLSSFVSILVRISISLGSSIGCICQPLSRGSVGFVYLIIVPSKGVEMVAREGRELREAKSGV